MEPQFRHFVLRLHPISDSDRRVVWVEGVVGGIVEDIAHFNAGAFGEWHWLGEAIIPLPVEIPLGDVKKLVGAAVRGIFVASVYRYATKGEAGQMFRNETVAAAFRPKT